MAEVTEPVVFTDVTLRDGLQAEKDVLPTETKSALFRAILSTGVPRIELTSFVSPKWVPQLADAEALCEIVFKEHSKLPETMAFVPNVAGLKRLQAFPIDWAACFIATSDAFNQKNVGASTEVALQRLEETVESARAYKRKVRVYVSTVFGCPYEGEISVNQVADLVEKVGKLKPDEIALGDTIGVATPKQVRDVLSATSKKWKLRQTALHLHNTYGMALASAMTGYEMGVRIFDGAFAGIGGCPYAKGASGNLSLEDLWYAFSRQGLVKPFDGRAVRSVLEKISEACLPARSQLGQIVSKGGSWFGMQ